MVGFPASTLSCRVPEEKNSIGHRHDATRCCCCCCWAGTAARAFHGRGRLTWTSGYVYLYLTADTRRPGRCVGSWRREIVFVALSGSAVRATTTADSATTAGARPPRPTHASTSFTCLKATTARSSSVSSVVVFPSALLHSAGERLMCCRYHLLAASVQQR